MMEPIREGAQSVAIENNREVTAQPSNSGMASEERPSLFVENEGRELRSKWERIQTNFVDEPRNAVKDADALVAAAIKRLEEIFAGEREKLEHEWDRGDDVSTEDLRLALRRYRAFFDRLLSM